MRTKSCVLLTVLAFVPVAALLVPGILFAQFIEFETLPGGGATVDQQQISTEYSVYGVTFTLLDPNTGLPSGVPRIAKAGAPQTAFEGCLQPDTPLPGPDLGVSFLTDGTSLGVQGDLLIEYATPVAQASGVILDIDCRVNGGPPCEQWTITAFDAADTPLQTVIIDAPSGAENPVCINPEAGMGDSQAFGWTFDTGTAQITSILLKHTSAAPNVGLAFDNFSVASLPGPPVATATSAATTICPGESLVLAAAVSDGLPPYTHQWQIETSPGVWIDLGTARTETVTVAVTTSYRVVVTDAQSNQDTSDALEIVVLEGDPLCAASLLVSSSNDNSVVRYSFVSRLPEVFVSSGSGGLDRTSALVCGPDANLYVSSQDNDRVLRYSGADGTFIDEFVAAGSGGLDIPIGLDFGPDGNLYVASYNTHSIIRYDGSTGTLIGTFIPTGSGLNGPTGIVWGSDDNLYICSWNGDKVLRFDSTGTFVDDFVTAGSGGLDAPRGLAFGFDDNLYVSEQYNDSVRRYDGANGAFISVFVPSGSGGLNRPNDVVFGLDDALYVAGFDNNQVMAYDGVTGTSLGALPDDAGLLDGPAWVTVGCQPYATPVEPPDPVSPFTRVNFHVGYLAGVGSPAALRFELDRPATVDLVVYDARGRKIASLLQGSYPAGTHGTVWRGTDEYGAPVARGLYFAQLIVQGNGLNEAVTRKLLVLR